MQRDVVRRVGQGPAEVTGAPVVPEENEQHRRHEGEAVAERGVVVPLAGTGERRDQAPLGQVLDLVADDFGQADSVVLEAQRMPAPEDPALELVFTVLDSSSAINAE